MRKNEEGIKKERMSRSRINERKGSMRRIRKEVNKEGGGGEEKGSEEGEGVRIK
jgi:hypothetical protein